MKRTDKVRFQCTKCGHVTKRQVAIKLAGKIVPQTCKVCRHTETYRIPEYRRPTKKPAPLPHAGHEVIHSSDTLHAELNPLDLSRAPNDGASNLEPGGTMNVEIKPL